MIETDFERASSWSEFERTMMKHAGELLGTAIRLTGSRAEGEDLVQDSVLRAWQFRAQFERGSNARAWMHRILMNTFINGYRRKRRERDILTLAGVEVDDELSPNENISLGDEVESALATLPDEFRTVLMRVDLNEQSYREVADALGCPIGTVMSRLHRARRVLKTKLRAYAKSEGYVHNITAEAA
ncbi:MAG: sigma-70 family RNA polymerase sigma factor [Sandaracinaceae bacterium]|jgi:RNA polymerase sigma-70 factor (ECF subfamily)|nr:sigma-70 family RNA polymerase sigma factor [Sandaracinaceae bacterium]